jgi:hypothetical protein
MSISAEQDRWLNRVVEQLRSIEGVAYELLDDGRIALDIPCNGDSRKIFMAGPACDYRALKHQYGQLCEALTELGIDEGAKFVAVRRSRRPMSEEMLAASAKKQQAFDAWQEVWRRIRKAEKSLDVEFEIAQMLDYY